MHLPAVPVARPGPEVAAVVIAVAEAAAEAAAAEAAAVAHMVAAHAVEGDKPLIYQS